jgi:uncharacterized protein (DUF1501 family)
MGTGSTGAASAGSDDEQPRVGYPPTHLGRALARAARLIRSDVGVWAISVDHSPWRMLANIGTVDHGRMKRMVDDLAGSVAAFFADLGTLGSTVTLLTTSEYGRRIQENAAGGLDDGYGNNMLVLGAGVKGGTVYGLWPGCDPAHQTQDGNLAVTTDYRSVLWGVAASRLPAADLPRLFPGFRPTPVGVIRNA